MPDEIAEVVAEDGPDGRSKHHAEDVEIVGRARIQGCRDEHGFARKRNACRLEADDDEDCEVAVLRDEAGQGTVKTTFPVYCSVSTYVVASTTSRPRVAPVDDGAEFPGRSTSSSRRTSGGRYRSYTAAFTPCG